MIPGLTPLIAWKETCIFLCMYAGPKSRILLANHASMIAKGSDTNALNCETCRLSVPACQRRMAIWVVCKVVDSFMHFIYVFIARMLARRLARYARAINSSTSLREVSIAVTACYNLLAGKMTRRMCRTICIQRLKVYLQVEVRTADMHAWSG